MGIRGLKSFIDNNSDLLRRHHLHDTHVVIDGNNLIFCLYWRSSNHSRDYIYGGDYCRFATTVEQFFKTLSKCNVKAVVVLDGGVDPSQKKFKTITDRFKKSLEEAKRISKYNITNEKVIPSLAKPVFISILDVLNVDHIQASYEADSCIARIANQLQCPVLSNDSDFFVYDLKCGVISIDSIDNSWIVRTADYESDGTLQYKYIDCCLYRIDNLIEYFPGLDRSILPLFSTLMGNDYVDSNVFHNIFSALPNVHSKRSKKSLHVGKRHSRMIQLLDFLRFKTIDEAILFFVTFLKKNARNTALDLLRLSLENYSEGKCDSEENFETTFDMNSVLMLNNDNSLPQWFVSEFQKSLLNSTFMNVIKMKFDIMSPRIEDFSLSSSYSCTSELRKFMYGLLRLNEDLIPITVFDREKSHLSSNQMLPYLCAPNSSQTLPNLFQIRNLDISERKLLLFQILSINADFLEKAKNLFLCDDSVLTYKHNDIDGAVFLTVVVKYWLSNSDNIIWIEFIYSLLTCIMFCGYIGSYNKIKYILFEKLTIKTINDNFSKFNSKPTHNCAKVFQPRIVHYFNEFQNCIKIIRSLDSLLEYPLSIGQPFVCLNGSFIYNLTTELSSRKDPVLYLSQLFGRNSLATNIFERFLRLFSDEMDSNKLVRCLQITNRRSHLESQKLKTKKKKTIKIDDLGNRFSALKVD